jgi:hypothetical protein
MFSRKSNSYEKWFSINIIKMTKNVINDSFFVNIIIISVSYNYYISVLFLSFCHFFVIV